MRSRKKHWARRVAVIGILVALAMIFSYVEAILPISVGVPGVKLGIANLVIVTGLYLLPLPEVCLISLVRILLSGLLFGNGMSLLYSLSGGILSLLLMVIAQKTKLFSVYGVSIIGAVFHNAGQILMAVLITGTPAIFLYLPILIGVGLVTGFCIGFLAGRIVSTWETQLSNLGAVK